MKIPILGKGKYILIKVDYKTGVILNNDGTFYLNEGENYYIVIENKEKAINIAKKHVMENKLIEVLLYEGTGEFIEVFRP